MGSAAVPWTDRTEVSVPPEGERFRGLYVVVRQPRVRHGGGPLLEAKLRLPLVAAVLAAEAQHHGGAVLPFGRVRGPDLGAVDVHADLRRAAYGVDTHPDGVDVSFHRPSLPSTVGANNELLSPFAAVRLRVFYDHACTFPRYVP